MLKALCAAAVALATVACSRPVERTQRTAPPPTPADWDGRRYDVGHIATLEGSVIGFDRVRREGVPDSAYFGDEEPRLGRGEFTNEDQQLRTYPLAEDAELLVSDECAPTGGGVYRVAPVSELREFVVAGDSNPILILSFTPRGQVARIREYVAC